MNIRNVVCRTKKNVDDLLILSNKAETGRLEFVYIMLNAADVEEVFSALARALSPTSLQVQWVLVQGREATDQLLQARRDDLRTIFESLDLAGELINLEDGAAFPVMDGFEDFEDYLNVWLFC